QKPVASPISFPLQSNFDFRIGPSDEGWRYTLNIQPLIPISFGSDWNLIVRTIVPSERLPTITPAPWWRRMFSSFAWLRGKIFLKSEPGALFVVIGGIIAASVLAEYSHCDMPSLIGKPRSIPAAKLAVASARPESFLYHSDGPRKSAFCQALGCRPKVRYPRLLPTASFHLVICVRETMVNQN